MENVIVKCVVKKVMEVCKELEAEDLMFSPLDDRDIESTLEISLKDEDKELPIRVIACDMLKLSGVTGIMSYLNFKKVSDVYVGKSIYEVITGVKSPRFDYALFTNTKTSETILVFTSKNNMDVKPIDSLLEDIVGVVNSTISHSNSRDLYTTCVGSFTSNLYQLKVKGLPFTYNEQNIDCYLSNISGDKVQAQKDIRQKYFSDCTLVAEASVKMSSGFNLDPCTPDMYRLESSILKRPDGTYVLLGCRE